MNKEDYFKYYIQGTDHYLIPKDIFDELFGEMENWKQDTQKYKEVIDKIEDLLILKKARCLNEEDYVLNVPDLDDILQALKEVE